MSRALLPLALVAVLSLAACGDDPSSSADAGTADAPLTGTVDVGMNRLKFDPDKITVKTGAKIVWTNLENVPHDVEAREGADFDSEVFGQDETYEYTTEKAGEIAYVCTLHPGMDGTITVVD
jgi:plastocyanin